MQAARRLALWLVPCLICLAVFNRGLFCWFQQDDFSWLRLEIHSWSDFWRLLVEPRAQGTIRPLSERLFFLAFRRLFDLHAFPYRLFVFLTQFANLVLLNAVVRRLPGSPAAGALASLVWGLNIGLLAPMAWSSAYNQVLCSFFYLAGLLLFLRHIETGRWSFYIWQCMVFVLGFGALETIVAYPLVLGVWCLLAARRHAWKALPLLAPSALYAAAHLWIIPRAASGPYALHLDHAILATLWKYTAWALGPVRYSDVAAIGATAAAALAVAMAAALLAGVGLARGNDRAVGLFGLGWFVLTLAPVLPLREHASDYYLTIPAIGLAIAVVAAARAAPRAAAAAWLATYIWCSVGFVRPGIVTLYERSQAARRVIEAVQQIRTQHPDKTILLSGVNDYLFYAAFYDEGFRTAGVRDVFLAPTNEGITSRAGLHPVDNYKLAPAATLNALRSDEAVVYDLSGGQWRNITARYSAFAPALMKASAPRRVDVAEPRMAPQLGPGWYGIQQNHRWMGRRAEVRLAGPRSAGERLRIVAIHSGHPAAGPVRLTVLVNGTSIGQVEIRDNRSGVHTFTLPASVVGREEITVVLETDRTFRIPTDDRDLGLAFGVIELVQQ